MSPLLHDRARGSVDIIEPGTAGRASARPSRTADEPASLGPVHITVRPGVRTRWSNELIAIGHPHLATSLAWLIDAGRGQIIVHLASTHRADPAALQVQCAAPARLAGALRVTADRADTRFRQGLVGLDGRVPGGHFPSVGAADALR